MRTTSDNSINSNLRLAMGLWPNASWTDELKALWRDRLEGLNQDIVADAIRLVKPQFSSHQPELKWVLTKCSELAEQRNPRFMSGNQRPTFWHASRQQESRHGPWTVRVGSWHPSHEEAVRAAASGSNGVVTSSDPSDEQYSASDMRAEEDEARHWVAHAEREEIAGLLVRLRKVGFCTRKLPGKVAGWTRMEAMTVYAAHVMEVR